MSRDTAPIPFRENSARALNDAALRHALVVATDAFVRLRTAAVTSIPFEDWRARASDIRMEVLEGLPQYVERFTEAATKVGAQVHYAVDASAAREVVASILTGHGVRKVVKAKSMVTEEIHLNHHLEGLGIEAVETDLGEYIVQLAGETPSHILAPAIHRSRKDVGKLFAEKLGVPYSEDRAVLTKVARKALREKFLAAEAGISGANFAVAETGSIAIFTNEGNGRMVTTLPRLHVAVFTIEKILPRLADLAFFARMLPRSASGQPLSSYLSIITGTRKPGEATGAEELHIVLLDNGRTRIRDSEFREILKCIRCSACLNVCPVFRKVGGHAYASTYPGPMGIVLTTLLDGMERAHPLLDATTLCGACSEVCPVKVPLVNLIRALRERKVEMGFTSGAEKHAMTAFGAAVGSPFLFRTGQAMWRVLWGLARHVDRPPLNRLPRPAADTFRRRLR